MLAGQFIFKWFLTLLGLSLCIWTLCLGCKPDRKPTVVEVMPSLETPKDGVWREWSSWSPCSSSCGSAERTRTRSCDPPVYGGQPCQGNIIHIEECQLTPCGVDGIWSPWTPWSACSPSCTNDAPSVQGQQQRVRQCDQPAPQNGGKTCEGSAQDIRRCKVGRCPQPIDGQWGRWGDWTACSHTCVSSSGAPIYQYRSRSCNSPPAQYGGKTCPGKANIYKECYLTNKCPVNGGWSDWYVRQVCTPRIPNLKCSQGLETLARDCNNPAPVPPGKLCPGTDLDKRSCWFMTGCPIGLIAPLNFTTIRAVTSIKVTWRRPPYGDPISGFYLYHQVTTPGSKPVKLSVPIRTQDPYGEEYSRTIADLDAKVSYTVWMQSVAVDKKTLSRKTKVVTAVMGETDGQWGHWGVWSRCSTSCFEEEGKLSRTRYCENPHPSANGNPCIGPGQLVEPCYGKNKCYRRLH